MTNTVCFGTSDTHIDFDVLEKPVHKLLVAPLIELKKQAKTAGFELCIASGFRSFQRQLDIWNGKARGERTVLDSSGQPLNVQGLSNTQRMFAILRWSALPGASRHHWGTDIDIYDANAIAIENLQLVESEYQSGGPCESLYCWLRVNAATDFFWPYTKDRGGVAPEPWHISYRLLAEPLEQQLSLSSIAELIEAAEIELKDEILNNLDTIFAKYIKHASDF